MIRRHSTAISFAASATQIVATEPGRAASFLRFDGTNFVVQSFFYMAPFQGVTWLPLPAQSQPAVKLPRAAIDEANAAGKASALIWVINFVEKVVLLACNTTAQTIDSSQLPTVFVSMTLPVAWFYR